VPRTLHRQLHEAAAERGVTATALILTAVNVTHAKLPAQLGPGVSRERGEELFDVPQSRRRDEPAVATTIRVTDKQFEALAALVDKHQSNRSAIITAALRLYLPTG